MDTSCFKERDPEFAELFGNFLEEVRNEEGQGIGPEVRGIAVLSTLIGCGGVDAFRAELPCVIADGVTPVMVKEVVYQATAYMGIGRSMPFIFAANEVMEGMGIDLPLEGQSTTTPGDRLEKGVDAQVRMFGEQMRDAWKNGHINRWLGANCFGDYYTRTGLDDRQREMVTFCLLMAQGGCEPQLEAHIRGNISVGNDAGFLLRVVSQCLPYIGYPRSLNAIAAIQRVIATI